MSRTLLLLCRPLVALEQVGIKLGRGIGTVQRTPVMDSALMGLRINNKKNYQ